MWWIACRAEDEQLQGKKNLLRLGVLVLGDLAGESWMNCSMPLRWWLVPLIHALVLFPNTEREGSQQRRANLKGAASTSYPGKSGLRLQKALVVTPSWAPR